MKTKKPKNSASRNKIHPETRQTLLQAANDAFRAIGFPALDEARATLSEIIQRGMAEGDFEKTYRSSTMIAFVDYIDNMTEPTAEKLGNILEKLRMLPTGFRTTLDQTVKEVKQNLPRKPGPGRRSSLNVEQQKEACLRVGFLNGKGVELSDAFVRVGRSFGVGPRTIQRAWQQRVKLHRTDKLDDHDS